MGKTVDIGEVIEAQGKSAFGLMIFLIGCLVMLVDGYDNQALNYAQPAIIKDFAIAPEKMAPVIAISIIGWMLGSVGFSMIGDRIGRRNAMLIAVFFFGALTLCIPLARDLIGLASLRFLAALGIGGAIPMAVALVSDYSKSKRRGLKIATLYLGYTFGSSGGGFLAADLTPAYGWRAIFIVGGVAAIAVGAMLIAILPESARYLVLKDGSEPRILELVRKLKPTIALSDETRFVISEPAEKGLPVKSLFTEGRAAMTIFLWIALGFSFVTHFYLSAWMTTLFSSYSGEMTIEQAQRTAAWFQMGAAYGFIMGWLLDKRGIPAVTLAMLLGAIPVAALGFVDAGIAVTMVLSALSGILVLGGAPGLNAISGIVYPTSVRCTGAGAAFAAARVGAVIGPLIAGALIGAHMPLNVIFVVGALPMLAAAAMTFLLDRSMTPAAQREIGTRTAAAE
ncbi:MAG TPA: MFS transporter [Micropepsaceae bacterium]|nr:MFS transporter [Micropepsaceae bacterium]